MKRPAPWLLLPVFAVGCAVALTLRGDAGVLRLPEDMVRSSTVTVRSRSMPLRDGTSRALHRWEVGDVGGFYQLVRGDERVSQYRFGRESTLLGVAGGAATLLKHALPASPKTPALTFERVGVAERRTPSRPFTVRLPEEFVTVHDILLSPDGRSLAWSVFVRRERPGVAWLRKRFPALVRNVAPRYADELWRSDADGARFQPIAAAPHSARKIVLKAGWNEDDGKIAALWNGAALTMP